MSAILLVAASLLGAPLQASPPVTDALGSTRCARPLAVAERFGTDVSRLEASGLITFGGHLVDVRNPQALFAGPSRGVAWNLWFHSWSWLADVARTLEPSVAVDLAVTWHVSNPDVGAFAPLHLLRSRGWTEGAVTQRMTTVTCLWSITGDERLRPIMDALVQASLDVERYYGRPRVAPHNRGAMANFALIAAGEEFREPGWESAALGRLTEDFPEVFADCGMDREQSASYFKHNYRLWLRAAASLRQKGDDSIVALMDERLDAARKALQALTLPSGSLPVIGDGSPVPGIAPSNPGDLHWWCEERGWAAGRDSWSDPLVHYTARFGPAMSAHGHDDHGSVTWWLGIGEGTPVLVDRGNPAKDRDPERRAWSRSKAAHNTFSPKGVQFRATSSATRHISDDSVSITVTDASPHRGVSRHREISFSLRSPEMVVTDSGQATRPVLWVQSWHLDSGWRSVKIEGAGAIAQHANGSRLAVRCTDTRDETSPSIRARLHVVPQFGIRGAEMAATTITCEMRGDALQIRTYLTVTP